MNGKAEAVWDARGCWRERQGPRWSYKPENLEEPPHQATSQMPVERRTLTHT